MAIASSGPTTEVPHRRDLFKHGWILSFPAVPAPGSISERQPLLMCSLNFCISLDRDSKSPVTRTIFQRSQKESIFIFVIIRLEVFIFLLSPKSPSCRNVRENSLQNVFENSVPFGTTLVTRCTAWIESSFTGTSPRTYNSCPHDLT